MLLSLCAWSHTITFDYCTFNNFGAGGSINAIMNAGSNPVKLNITNSIVANIPRPGGTVNTSAINATGAGMGIVFSNNNTPLAIPAGRIKQQLKRRHE